MPLLSSLFLHLAPDSTLCSCAATFWPPELMFGLAAQPLPAVCCSLHIDTYTRVRWMTSCRWNWVCVKMKCRCLFLLKGNPSCGGLMFTDTVLEKAEIWACVCVFVIVIVLVLAVTATAVCEAAAESQEVTLWLYSRWSRVIVEEAITDEHDKEKLNRKNITRLFSLAVM